LFPRKNNLIFIFRVFGRPLRIRLGEWDASSASEPIAAQEYQVSRVFVHPQFTASNLRNNIAILRLATPVPLGQTPSISTVNKKKNVKI
jgi:secreted trypsin-like serine protease